MAQCTLGQAEYPERADEIIAAAAGKLVELDALAIAEEAGSSKAVNVVLLGAASGDLPFSREEWLKVIEDNVKPKFVELNKEAFVKGAGA